MITDTQLQKFFDYLTSLIAKEIIKASAKVDLAKSPKEYLELFKHENQLQQVYNKLLAMTHQNWEYQKENEKLRHRLYLANAEIERLK